MTLRVRTSIESESIVFTVSGRIQSIQVPDLKAMLESQSSDVVLDGRDATNRPGDRPVFVNLEARGMQLRNYPPSMRQWIDQETSSLVRSAPAISGK